MADQLRTVFRGLSAVGRVESGTQFAALLQGDYGVPTATQWNVSRWMNGKTSPQQETEAALVAACETLANELEERLGHGWQAFFSQPTDSDPTPPLDDLGTVRQLVASEPMLGPIQERAVIAAINRIENVSELTAADLHMWLYACHVVGLPDAWPPPLSNA